MFMGKPSFSFTSFLREEFEKYPTLSLNKLYSTIENFKLDLQEDVIKHRIRSGIYHLQKTNKIKRTSPRTYTKI
jgi:hypothetical protein